MANGGGGLYDSVVRGRSERSAGVASCMWGWKMTQKGERGRRECVCLKGFDKGCSTTYRCRNNQLESEVGWSFHLRERVSEPASKQASG